MTHSGDHPSLDYRSIDQEEMSVHYVGCSKEVPVGSEGVTRFVEPLGASVRRGAATLSEIPAEYCDGAARRLSTTPAMVSQVDLPRMDSHAANLSGKRVRSGLGSLSAALRCVDPSVAAAVRQAAVDALAPRPVVVVTLDGDTRHVLARGLAYTDHLDLIRTERDVRGDLHLRLRDPGLLRSAFDVPAELHEADLPVVAAVAEWYSIDFADHVPVLAWGLAHRTHLDLIRPIAADHIRLVEMAEVDISFPDITLRFLRVTPPPRLPPLNPATAIGPQIIYRKGFEPPRLAAVLAVSDLARSTRVSALRKRHHLTWSFLAMALGEDHSDLPEASGRTIRPKNRGRFDPNAPIGPQIIHRATGDPVRLAGIAELTKRVEGALVKGFPSRTRLARLHRLDRKTLNSLVSPRFDENHPLGPQVRTLRRTDCVRIRAEDKVLRQFSQGDTVGELARRHRMSENEVKTWLKRARDRLEPRPVEYDGAEFAAKDGGLKGPVR